MNYEYNQILKELKWDFKDARLSEPWEWFEEQLKRKLEEKVIDESLYEKEMWKELQLLIHDRQEHMLYMRKKDDVYNENINSYEYLGTLARKGLNKRLNYKVTDLSNSDLEKITMPDVVKNCFIL